jgi:succinyl-CoA synthetase beta subunit
MRCDRVANGIIEALGRVELEVPMVVRLDGTNAEEGREILTKAAIDGVEMAPTMLEAAELAVERAGG